MSRHPTQGVFLCVENNAYHEDGGRGLLYGA